MFSVFFLVTVIFILAVFLFLQQPNFGKAPAGKRLESIRKSANFKNGKFQNQSFTPDLAPGVSYYTIFKEYFFNKSRRSLPPTRLPSQKTNLHALHPNKNILVWFGHSSYFLQLDGKKILVDPVLSGAASPVKFTTNSYPGSDVYTTDDIPEIDFLFLSHDHWDHLDYETITRLKPKIKKVITGLGTGAHLEYWGYNSGIIIEKDWYETVELDAGFTVITTPARHFSGRGLKRNGVLWLAFILQTPSLKIYLGGDSGYDSHFTHIGNTYGPFDLAILECGQYHEYWHNIHLLPDEVVLAAQDLKVKRLMPVHWSKFTLALHAWDEPIIQVSEIARKKNIPLLTPLIGEAVDLQTTFTSTEWWKHVQLSTN